MPVKSFRQNKSTFWSFFSSKLPPLRNGDFKKGAASSQSSNTLSALSNHSRSICLPSLNITKITSSLHIVLLLSPRIIPNLSYFSSSILSEPLFLHGRLEAEGSPELPVYTILDAVLNEVTLAARNCHYLHTMEIWNWQTPPGLVLFLFLKAVKLLAHYYCPQNWHHSSWTTLIMLRSLDLVSDKLELEFWLIDLVVMWHWASYVTCINQFS